MNEIDNPIDLEDDSLDWYEEELIDFVREETEDSETITSLLDQDILYLYELWDDYTQQIEGDEEVVEVDPQEFYEYALETASEDGQDIAIPIDDMILLIQLQQEFDESLGDEDDSDE